MAVLKLINKTKIPQHFVERAIEFYERDRDEYIKAVIISCKADMIKKTIEILENAGSFVRVFWDWVEAEAENNDPESLKNYKYAALLAEENGLFERAMYNYREAKMFKEAARAAKNAGLTEEANSFYTKVIEDKLKQKYLGEAGLIIEEAGMTEKPDELYVKAFKMYKETDYYVISAEYEKQQIVQIWYSPDTCLLIGGS